MKRFFLLMASMAGLLCLSGTRAHAQVDWSYSYSPTTLSVPATPTGGSLQFPSASLAPSVGSSTITLANLQLQTTNSGTETLATGSLPFSGTITITDSNGASGSITLSGSLTGYGGTNPSFAAGTVGGTGGFSNIISSSLALSNPVGGGGTWSSTGSGASQAYVWTDSKTGNTFSIPVADLSITPPGQPSPFPSGTGSGTVTTNPTLGSISAYVVVNGSTPGGGGTGPGTGTGTTSSVPEPSTLVLSCFGLSFAGLASWRKRRRNVKA